MLEEVTPATNRLLTTREAVKTELQIVTVAEHDVFLNMLIEQASDAIVSYCNRPFAFAELREHVAGDDTSFLTLSRTPIVGVTSILMNNQPILDYRILDADAGILQRVQGWFAEGESRWWSVVHAPVSKPHYIVTYTAGYVLPGDTGRNLPGVIERACIDTVKSWFLARERDPVIKSEKLGDWQASYGGMYSTDGLPASVAQMLSSWRRFV